MNMPKEQIPAIELHSVRNADVTDGSARPRDSDRLRHRLLCADAFEHRIRPDALREFLDTRDAFLAALGHDVSRAELACEPLTRRMTAHGDDALGTHLLGR